MLEKVRILEVAEGETMKKRRRNKEREGKTDYVKYQRLKAEENQLESVQFECWWGMNSDCWGGHHQGHGRPRPGSFRRIQKNGEWLQNSQKKALCISTKDFFFFCRRAQKKEIEEKETKLVEGDGIGGWAKFLMQRDSISYRASE